MPRFNFSTAMTANQLGLNPLSGWQYEYVPAAWGRGAAVRLITNATTTGVRLSVSSGSQTIQERSPVQGGGTAGVLPSELNSAPLTFVATPGDRLKLSYDEVAAGTPTVNGVIEIEPL